MNLFKRLAVATTLGAALVAPSIAAPTCSWAPTVRAYATGEPKWPRMRAGETDHDWVLCLQYLLRARGYRVGVDGHFGSQTTSAVKRFQRANCLAADGSVGPQTWPLLCRTLRQGDKGDAVRALQVLLNEGGAADAPGQGMRVDGVFGAKTADAVREVQRYLKEADDTITLNGVADAAVWAGSLQADNTHA